MPKRPTEGWNWLWNATKWHYFVEGRSLCGRWMLLSTEDLQTGKDESPANCVKCKKLLKERKSQLGQEKNHAI